MADAPVKFEDPSFHGGKVVGGAPAPLDQEEGRVVAGDPAPLPDQGAGEGAHHRPNPFLGVLDAVDPGDELLLAELLAADIVLLDQAVGEAQHPVADLASRMLAAFRGSCPGPR